MSWSSSVILQGRFRLYTTMHKQRYACPLHCMMHIILRVEKNHCKCAEEVVLTT